MAELINENFDSSYLTVVEGDASTSEELLNHRFDKIFFTGSTRVGKIVAAKAAKNLTPVTLELGGKSPCVVLADADLALSCKRIIWGKFLNAGQTCIAPDYLLVEKIIYNELLAELSNQIKLIFGDDPAKSDNYPRIINRDHIKRLEKLIDRDKVVTGGIINEDEIYMSPRVTRKISTL
jgi:aldehyde dehydrogenase (NAD+)